MVVILHNVRSLFNVGSIFRTADAVGTEKIYLAGLTPAPIDRFGETRSQLAKVALGAEKNVPWEKVSNAITLMRKLRKEGYAVFAIEQSKGSIPYHALNPRRYPFGKIALIVGNEVRGLPSPVLREADKALEIPMSGKKESLNVAVAFGIAAYHLRFGAKTTRRRI